MSKLLRETNDEIKNGNLSLKDKFKYISNKFLNATEVGAQEAVYILLGQKVSCSSRDNIFINTFVPEKRYHVTLPKGELKKLSPDSTHVFRPDQINRYKLRPNELEDVTLTDFLAEYKITKSKNENKEKNESAESDYEEHEEKYNKRHERILKDGTLVRKREKPLIIRSCNFPYDENETNFEREQLMLYTPWRNEEKELLTKTKQMYEQNKPLIFENKKKYHFYDDDLHFEEKIREKENKQMDSFEDKYENELNDEQDEFSILYNENQFDTLEYGENKSYSGGVSKKQDYLEKQKIPDVMDTEEFTKAVLNMNVDQYKYFYNILHKFKTKKYKLKPIYEFVCGQAGNKIIKYEIKIIFNKLIQLLFLGVGKSFLLRLIYNALVKYFAKLQNVTVLVLAPTGKAAFNINGMTIHTAFVIGRDPEVSVFSPEYALKIRLYWISLVLIFVDEISMVGNLVWAALNKKLQQVFENTLLFGGISIIVVGDFLQLKPVRQDFVFQLNKYSAYGYIAGVPLWECFKIFKLTIIERQKDDLEFAKALNRLGRGEHDTNDVKLLQTRIITKKDDSSINIFRTNEESGIFNVEYLLHHTVFNPKDKKESYSTNIIKSVTKNTVLNDDIIKDALNKASYVTKNICGITYKIDLQVDVMYRIIKNINIKDGLVNGATGYLKKIYCDPLNLNKPVIIWLEFENDRVGLITRKEESNHMKLLAPNICPRWVPIKNNYKETFNVSIGMNQHVTIERTHWPFVISQGLTTYATQSSTYKSIVVHPVKEDNNRSMERREIYTAFSRVTTLKGLSIYNKFESPPLVKKDDIVKVEMERLEKECPLILDLIFFNDKKYEFYTKIIIHNVQSLKCHFEYIKKDINFLNANLINLTETWVKDYSHYNLDGFTMMASECGDSENKTNGMVTYSKDNTTNNKNLTFIKSGFFFEPNKNKTHYLLIQSFLIVKNIHIIMLYKSNEALFDFFIQHLEKFINQIRDKTKLIITGDFNIDISDLESTNSLKLQNFMEKYNLKFIIEPNQISTNNDTQIDLCLSNLNNNEIFASYFPCVFSYHNLIQILIKN